MKAAILRQINEPLELCEVTPHQLEYGQVLVRLIASGICGAQLNEIAGHKGTHFPRLMGHEGVGMVMQVGPGVTHVKEGDKVVCHWRKGAGIESAPPKYTLDGETITSGQVTTFSEYSIISENRLTAVPKDTPDELCCLLGCSLSTALGTIESEAQLRGGESILIIGCGGLGLNLILAAKLHNASLIVAADIHESKKPSALRMGANFFINPTGSKFCPEGESFAVHRYDVIVDTTGNRAVMENSLLSLAPSGRFIMVGQPKPGACFTIANALHFFEGTGKSLKATQGGGFNPTLDVPRYIRMHRSHAFSTEGLITHRLPLEKINAGIDLVRNGQAGRLIIEMPKP